MRVRDRFCLPPGRAGTVSADARLSHAAARRSGWAGRVGLLPDVTGDDTAPAMPERHQREIDR